MPNIEDLAALKPDSTAVIPLQDVVNEGFFPIVNRSPVTGNTVHTRPENRAYFPALDGIRALAFVMVLGQHYAATPWGWTGVDIFFVLSGFLITGILFDSRDDPHRVRNFYIRRTLRIFPLYYGIFLVLLLSTPLIHWSWLRSWIAWPLYLGNYLRFLHPYILRTPWQRIADAQLSGTNAHGITVYMGHFWSLCVEEQFYLFWPWVVFFVRSRRTLLWICGCSVLLMPLVRIWANTVLPQNMLDVEILYRATPFRIDALLLGGLVALWYRGTQRDAMLKISHWLFWLCAAISVAYLLFTVHRGMDYIYPAWKFTWGLSFIDLFAASALVVALQPGSVLYRLFKLRPLRWLGRISYGAYVFHDLFHGALLKLLNSTHLLQHIYGAQKHARYAPAFIALVITCVIAWLSFRFFETPFLNLKERWTIRTS